MKRIFTRWLMLGLGCASALRAATDGGPNFVVIMAEAQGWPNTSVMMDDRLPASKSGVFKTPAVERLAREGMRFAYGYALSPRCTPSPTPSRPTALRPTPRRKARSCSW